MDPHYNPPPAALTAALPEYQFDGSRPDLFEQTFSTWTRLWGGQLALDHPRPDVAPEGQDLNRLQRVWDESNEKAVLCLSRCTTREVFALLNESGPQAHYASSM